MRAARWTGYLLLPIALLLERSGWFASRSVLWEWIAGEGAENAELATSVVGNTMLAFTLSPLLGALAGWLLGARATLLSGLVAMLVGLAALAFAPAMAWPAVLLLVIGVGLARPAFLATGAAVSPDPASASRGALFFLLYWATAAAALGGPAIAAAFGSQELFGVVATGAVLVFGGLLLAGVHVLVARISRAPADAETASGARPAMGIVVLLLALVLGIALLRQVGALQQMSMQRISSSPGWMHPAFLLGFLPLIALLWSLYGLKGIRVATAGPVGLGLIVLALAPAPLFFGSLGFRGNLRDLAEIFSLFSPALSGLGEALVMPFLLARICAVSRKASVAAAAAWLLAGSATSFALGFLPENGIPALLSLLVLSFLGLAAGIVLLLLRRRIEASFEG